MEVKMLILHKINEVRVYCGPGALIAITGKPLPEVRTAINKAIGRRENIGVTKLSLTHLEGGLKNLNIKYTKYACTQRISLIQLVEKVLEKDVRYIVYITGHYVTLLNGLLIDNHYRFGTEAAECRWINKVVKSYLKID